jgi:hypothetical protein
MKDKKANGKRAQKELNIIQAIELAIAHELMPAGVIWPWSGWKTSELQRLLREIAGGGGRPRSDPQEPPGSGEEKHLLRDTISPLRQPEM